MYTHAFVTNDTQYMPPSPLPVPKEYRGVDMLPKNLAQQATEKAKVNRPAKQDKWRADYFELSLKFGLATKEEMAATADKFLARREDFEARMSKYPPLHLGTDYKFNREELYEDL